MDYHEERPHRPKDNDVLIAAPSPEKSKGDCLHPYVIRCRRSSAGSDWVGG